MSRAARFLRDVLSLLALAALAALLLPAGLPAQQPRSLSVDEAIHLAHASSEAIVAARAAIDDAAGNRTRAAGERRMRVDAFSTVERALRSEYDGIDFGAPSDGADALPFGSPTTYRMGLALSQPLFSGWRATALGRAAARGEEATHLALASTRAVVALDVATAYYDAALGEQLVAIVEGTLAQADSTLAVAARLFEAGRGSEFDLLRARFARDRQRPAVVRQRGARDVALLRLRQLVDLPADAPVLLTSPLEPVRETAPLLATVAHVRATRPGEVAMVPAPVDAALVDWIAVREAAARLEQRRQLVHAARAQRWPGVALVSRWERVAYARGDFPANRDFRTNWTVGARLDMPLLSAGQHPADDAQAHAAHALARAELRRAEELSRLAIHAAATRLATADAAWRASEGGVEQAARAHEIALLRHREGLAIRLELDDARLALEAARSERARAARDLVVERARSRLLPALPPALTADAR